MSSTFQPGLQNNNHYQTQRNLVRNWRQKEEFVKYQRYSNVYFKLSHISKKWKVESATLWNIFTNHDCCSNIFWQICWIFLSDKGEQSVIILITLSTRRSRFYPDKAGGLMKCYPVILFSAWLKISWKKWKACFWGI